MKDSPSLVDNLSVQPILLYLGLCKQLKIAILNNCNANGTPTFPSKTKRTGKLSKQPWSSCIQLHSCLSSPSNANLRQHMPAKETKEERAPSADQEPNLGLKAAPNIA